MGFVSNTNKGARNLVDLVKYLYGDIVRRIGIDDTATERTSTWSSQKTSQELATKAVSSDISSAVSTHNTNTSAHSNVIGNISSIYPTHTDLVDYIDDTNDSIGTLSDQVLHLTGGTVTGKIKFSGTSSNNIGLSHTSTSQGLYLRGATSNADGAIIQLYGKDYSASKGYFNIKACNGTSTATLIGTPAGSLKWGGNEVLTEANGATPASVTSSISSHNSESTAHSNVIGSIPSSYETVVAYIDDVETTVSGFDTRITTAQTTANDALPKSGGTMSGPLTMGTQNISMGGANLSGADSVLSYGGKVLERVSESGPGYIHYASGIKICWTTTSLSNEGIWEFPIQFSSAPTVFSNLVDVTSATYMRHVNVSSISTASCTIQIRDTAGGIVITPSDSFPVCLVAIGV